MLSLPKDGLCNLHLRYARMVERTLENGTVLKLKLEPLSGERVRVLEYHRKAPGERWQRLRVEKRVGRCVITS